MPEVFICASRRPFSSDPALHMQTEHTLNGGLYIDNIRGTHASNEGLRHITHIGRCSSRGRAVEKTPSRMAGRRAGGRISKSKGPDTTIRKLKKIDGDMIEVRKAGDIGKESNRAVKRSTVIEEVKESVFYGGSRPFAPSLHHRGGMRLHAAGRKAMYVIGSHPNDRKR